MKLVDVDSSGAVKFTSSSLWATQSPREYVVQNFLILLLMTPGTNIEFASMGGGVRKLLTQRRRSIEELRANIAESMDRISATMVGMVPCGDVAHTVRSVTLQKVDRSADGGLRIYVNFTFVGAKPMSNEIPMEEL